MFGSMCSGISSSSDKIELASRASLTCALRLLKSSMSEATEMIESLLSVVDSISELLLKVLSRIVSLDMRMSMSKLLV